MQKWFDKAAVAAVAVLLSAGLLVALPALGAYWQYKVTEDAWKIIEAHIAPFIHTAALARWRECHLVLLTVSTVS
jgi:hypothetical protein